MITLRGSVKRYKIITALVILLGIFYVASFLRAQEIAAVKGITKDQSIPSLSPITVGGNVFGKEDLIRDFIKIAFSETLRDEETGEDAKYLFRRFLQHRFVFDKKLKENENIKEILPDIPDVADYQRQKDEFENMMYPWAQEYLRRPNGFPKVDVINKWKDKEIAIGIDWPIYTLNGWPGTIDMREGQPVSTFSAFRDRHQDVYQEIRGSIEPLLPKLERASGIKFRLQMNSDPRERTKEYARIRIIPINTIGLYNYFKFHRWYYFYSNVIGGNFHLETDMNNWLGGVTFTPFTRSQVDGYLLPHEDNSLGMSFCKVLPIVGKEMLKALITECVVRSLGLPNLSQENETAILGNWNKAYDGDSKLMPLDGRAAVIGGGGNPGYVKPTKEEFAKVKKDIKPAQFSEYDALMLKLLYCPAIKPGMDKYAAITELAQDNTCWK
jgi:hypothetical protein